MTGWLVCEIDGLVTVQDLGRTGWAHIGVPRAGAVDEPAARLANRLVGNPVECAVLEAAWARIRLRTDHASRVAVTGAPAQLWIDGRPRGAGAWPVPAGAEVRVERPDVGLRTYLAWSGGVAVEPVLGSRSRDVLAGIGPRPLAGGDLLPAGSPAPAPIHWPSPAPARRRGVLRVGPGPRQDWFTAQAWQVLTGNGWRVGTESNRVGLRLQGPPLERARRGELPSEPLVLGAVQVPSDGQPLIFLHDHPTTGGYPVIGVVREDDLHECAQAEPGSVLRFTPVSASATG